ncbi:MAG: metallophosphoesterase [Candidatus Aenigmatarchaeota archaeon]
MSQLKFVTNEPAIVFCRTLFIADLHIGIENEYRVSGLNIPSQTEKILSRIESLLKKSRAKNLVLIGDIKHRVPGTSWQEEKEIPVFLSRLSEKADINIVPGNHDGGIAEFLPKGVKIYDMEGFLFGDVYACHGHAWPERSFLDAKYLLISHSHPQIEFKDSLGYRWGERVWVRTNLNPKIISEKYKITKLPKPLPELIIMPAFNPLCGGIPVNKKIEENKDAVQERQISPLINSAFMSKARIYMLDGTYLGELRKLKNQGITSPSQKT